MLPPELPLGDVRAGWVAAAPLLRADFRVSTFRIRWFTECSHAALKFLIGQCQVGCLGLQDLLHK